MTFTLSVALRWVCYSAVCVSGTVILNLVVGYGRDTFDNVDFLIAPLMSFFFAAVGAGFYALSRLQLEHKTSAAMILVRPVLWVASLLVVLVNIRMLLFFFVG